MIRSLENFLHRFWPLRFRLVLGIPVVFLSLGCATVIQPIGEWAYPSELGLDATSLVLTKIAVKCGVIEGAKIREVQVSELCSALNAALASLGADEIQSGEMPDFTVWYLDKAASSGGSSWASTLAFSLTGGIVPMVSSVTAEAELRVVDSRGVELERTPMLATEVRSFGWLSLAALLKREKQLSRKRDLERRFFQFVQNRVYSQAIRLQLANRDAKGEEL